MGHEHDIVVTLGKSALTTRDEQETVHRLTGPLDFNAIARILQRNRVGSTARRHLAALAANNRLHDVSERSLESLAIALERPEASVLDLRRTLETAAYQLRAANLPALVIKGGSFIFSLPSYTNRQNGDVDFVLPDLRTLWLATRVLICSGYTVDENETSWIRNYSRAGVALQAHVALTDPQSGYTLDLHSHNMSAGPGLLQCDLFGRAKPVSTDSGTVLIPSPEDSLLIVVAHGFSHGYFVMKDMNDIVEIVRAHGDAIDWDYVAEQIASNELDDAMAYLSQRLRDIYGLRLGATFKAKSSIMRYGLHMTDGIGGKPSVLRLALVYAISDFFYGRKQKLTRRAISACRWWAWSLVMGLRTATKIPEWAERLTFREPNSYFPNPPFSYPIFLARLERPHDIANIAWDQDRWRTALSKYVSYSDDSTLAVKKGHEELVLTPAGAFAPTQTMIFSGAQWARLEEFGTEVEDVLRATNRFVDPGENVPIRDGVPRA